MKEKVNFDALPTGSSFDYGTSETWFKAPEVFIEPSTRVFSSFHRLRVT